MKSTNKLLALAAIAVTAMSSCSTDEGVFNNQGEGTIYLSARTDASLKARSVIGEEEVNWIWISKSGGRGLVREYTSLDDVPAEGIKLISDTYVAEAWAGDSVPASFTDRYFYGSDEFVVEDGSRTQVTIKCAIQNTVVSVEYDDNVTAHLSDISMTVGNTQGSLEFAGDNADRWGYFMTNSHDDFLDWTLTATKDDGGQFTAEGRLEAVERTTHYTLHVTLNENETEIGGAYFNVVVDTEPLETIEDNAVVELSPRITGINFNLDEVQRGEASEIGRKSLWITTTAPIVGLDLNCVEFQSKYGLTGPNFDLFKMVDQNLKATILASGITCNPAADPTVDITELKLSFEEEFMASLPEGRYDIVVTVTDANDKTGTATLSLNLSTASIATGEAPEADIWATHAVITGTVIKEGTMGAVLKYRPAGTATWTTAQTTLNGSELSATITGLTPGTTYQFAAATDDEEGDVVEFTTESANQMPNSSFEDGYQVSGSKKPFYFFAEGGQMFWDSGNTGSATMSVQVTQQATDKVKDGTYSAKLTSAYPSFMGIGKFAAGNIFVGEYLDTQGTDGVLGWGRAWTTRPTKLHGWAHYTAGKSTYCEGMSKGVTPPAGKTDVGIIYFALLDNSIMKSYNSANYPVIIKTATSELFSSEDSNVIAYGEVRFESDTQGDDLQEFTVDIVYKRTDVKPSFIVCTASASVEGDYFKGFLDSTLYLDALELIYE